MTCAHGGAVPPVTARDRVAGGQGGGGDLALLLAVLSGRVPAADSTCRVAVSVEGEHGAGCSTGCVGGVPQAEGVGIAGLLSKICGIASLNTLLGGYDVVSRGRGDPSAQRAGGASCGCVVLGAFTGAGALTSGSAPCTLSIFDTGGLGRGTILTLHATLAGGLNPLTNRVLFASILTWNDGACSAASLAGSVPHTVHVVLTGCLIGMCILAPIDTLILAHTAIGILGALVKHLCLGH